MSFYGHKSYSSCFQGMYSLGETDMENSVILFALMCRVNPIFPGISSMPQFLPEGLYIPQLTEMAASPGLRRKKC